MTGLDSAIATLLAGRADMLLSAISPSAGATAGQTTTQAGTSRLFVDIPQGAPGSVQNSVPGAGGPSAQTALSAVARTLDAISRFGGNGALTLTGNAPLWPTPPRAVSAFATLSGGLFDTAFGSNAAAVAAAVRAANQPAPALPAAALAAALAKMVDESGLFYESHLVQWLAGQRTAASLAGEPQARADSRTMPLPLDFAAARGDTANAANAAYATDAADAADAAEAAEAWLDGPQLSRASGAGFPDAQSAARTVALPQTPQQAAALAASVRDVPETVFSTPASASAAAAALRPRETAVQASLAAGIHPSTIPLVRQQLDVLATDQFRWSGEAWPGARFEWEISPRERDARAHDGGIEDERAWRTRLTLSLPTLGTVDAELVLTGQQLSARINASADGAARLVADGDAFRRQLEAAGIGLAALSIRGVDAPVSADAQAGGEKPVPSPLAHLFRAHSGDTGSRS